MRQALSRAAFAAAISLGLAGAAAAAPTSAPAAPTGDLTLSKDVPVAWSQWHGRHYGWRHRHFRPWHHRRHWGYRRHRW